MDDSSPAKTGIPATFSANDYELTDVRFFEAGNDAPDASDRVYADRFSQEATRRVYTEVKVKNFRYKDRPHTHEVVWIYHNPDGSLRGRMEGRFTVKDI